MPPPLSCFLAYPNPRTQTNSLKSCAEGLAAPAVASVWVKVLLALLRNLGLGTFFLCEVENILQMRFFLLLPFLTLECSSTPLHTPLPSSQWPQRGLLIPQFSDTWTTASDTTGNDLRCPMSRYFSITALYWVACQTHLVRYNQSLPPGLPGLA